MAGKPHQFVIKHQGKQKGTKDDRGGKHLQELLALRLHYGAGHRKKAKGTQHITNYKIDETQIDG
ncbi:hypothetical protein FAK_05930 [Desulfoferula mesophila]|uniref:Uncharacterized protein n=1 Tax=Desulfoferula mesophila TaxID=3058419 RepID=A0AAU9F0M1_9BACT|nr:hypothetical protein FAK_05930 [Desulfoferula mesophilus]